MSWCLYCSALRIHSDDYGFCWVREHVVYLGGHDGKTRPGKVTLVTDKTLQYRVDSHHCISAVLEIMR